MYVCICCIYRYRYILEWNYYRILTSMAASVWMYSMLVLDRPNSLLPLCTELTIPDVIVLRKENGLPMATTNSPCRTSDDRPRVSVGKGFYMSGEKEQLNDTSSQLTGHSDC